MQDRFLQILGLSGSSGAWIASKLEFLNSYLETVSLIIGIALGAWAICDRIKKRRKAK